MKTLSTLLFLVFSADQILGRTTSTGDAGMSCFLSVSNLQHSGKGTNPDTYYKLSVNGEYIRGSKEDVRRDMKASLWQFDLDSVLEDSDIIEVVSDNFGPRLMPGLELNGFLDQYMLISLRSD